MATTKSASGLCSPRDAAASALSDASLKSETKTDASVGPVKNEKVTDKDVQQSQSREGGGVRHQVDQCPACFQYLEILGVCD